MDRIRLLPDGPGHVDRRCGRIAALINGGQIP
jgi:hypothetical protein